MERNEISIHEVMIAAALKRRSGKWLSNRDIGAMLHGDIMPRTVRKHTLRFFELGILDHAEIFPAHRYKWNGKAQKRNAAYLIRLANAASVFGVKW